MKTLSRVDMSTAIRTKQNTMKTFLPLLKERIFVFSFIGMLVGAIIVHDRMLHALHKGNFLEYTFSGLSGYSMSTPGIAYILTGILWGLIISIIPDILYLTYRLIKKHLLLPIRNQILELRMRQVHSLKTKGIITEEECRKKLKALKDTAEY